MSNQALSDPEPKPPTKNITSNPIKPEKKKTVGEEVEEAIKNWLTERRKRQ